MDVAQIKALISEAVELDELHVAFDGSKCQVIAVAAFFNELTRVKRQQVIYQPLQQVIENGTIHAVTIKTFAPEQWKREKMFNLPI